MRKIAKLLSILALACLMLLSATLIACKDKEFAFTESIPEKVTYGSEIYFREYIPTEYGAEYELYVSYHDPEEDKDVENEKLDSLLFRFEKITDYNFTLKKTSGKKGELNCMVECYPELPKFEEVSEYSVKYIGFSLRLNDLLTLCKVKIENEEAATVDTEYHYVFKSVTVKSLLVGGTDEVIDLSDKTLSDKFVFEKEAIYEFNVKAVNRTGEVDLVLVANTADKNFHSSEVSGYYYADDKKIEFTMDQHDDTELGLDAVADGASVNVRLGTTKGTAVYDADTQKYTVNNFDGNVERGKPLRLLVERSQACSVMVVAPTLVVNQSNVRELELATDGYIVLNGDIDMSKVDFGTYVDANGVEKPGFWGSNRIGHNYTDYLFKGYIDGQGHTISNLVAAGWPSYATGLIWSCESSTIKNINFTKATVSSSNSVVCGRATLKSKFENISVEVSSLGGKDASVITGPTGQDIEYKNILMYVNNIAGETLTGTSFFGGYYSTSIKAANVYCVTDLDQTRLPTTPQGHRIITAISGTYTRTTREELLLNNGSIKKQDMPTQLLADAFDRLFINYMVKLDKDNIGLLQTATSDEFWLMEDIDMSTVDINGDGVVNENDVWNATTTFNGVLDGKGHSITNFPGPNLFNGFAGTVKDINFLQATMSGGLGFLSNKNGELKYDAKVENSVFEFKTVKGNKAALLGLQTGGTVTLKNVYVEMPSSQATAYGFLTTHAMTGYVLDKVFFVGGNGSLHSTSGNATHDHDKDTNTPEIPNPAYTYAADRVKNANGSNAVVGTDYYIIDNAKSFVDNYKQLAPENIKNAFDNDLMSGYIEIDSSNIGILQSATGGYYKLTENIDFATAFNGAWTPTETFSGTLDGAGYVISNFSGASLFKNFAGTVKNINFIDANLSSGKGFLAGGVENTNIVTNNISIENSIFKFKTVSGNRASLIGYQMGGIATLKNVYVEMPTNTNKLYGFITCHAITGLTFDNVCLVGGNGDISAQDSQNGTNYWTEDKVKGLDGQNAEKGVDYVIATSTGELKYEMPDKIPAFVNTAINNGLLSVDAMVITASNIGVLQNAKSGYYVLNNDIDFATAFTGTWTPTETFAGILNGNGKTIKNFSGASLFKNFAGTVKNINFVDANLSSGKGFLAGGANISSNVTIENSIFKFKTVSGGWAGLVGYVTGGIVTLKDVYIEMPSTATSANYGYVSCHALTGINMDNVFMVGALSDYHSTTSSNNQNYKPDNPTYGKGAVGTKDVDYFILKNAAQVYYEYSNLLPTNIKNSFVNGVLTYDAVVLTEENFYEKLYTATGGYYVLSENIDMTKVNGGVWNPSVAFGGILYGGGYTISNITTNKGGAGLFHTLNGVVKNIDLHVKTLSETSGVLGRIGNGFTIKNVNVYIESSGSSNCGLIMAIQGNGELKDVHIYDTTNNATGFIAGQQISDGKLVTVSNVYLYGDNKAINGSTTGKLVGATGADAVQGTDYYLFTTNIASAIETHAPNFIKNLCK